MNRSCADTMSGMPHPKTVVVVYGGEELRGCGGRPAELLQGAEWVVEDVNGGGILAGSRGTLHFGSDGSISGRSFCNAYSGSYTLTGEGLSITLAASTRMACTPPLMDQEKVFTDLLADVRRFEVGADGALILHTDDGRTIRAGRP
jgi:heat shock protein HslJ